MRVIVSDASVLIDLAKVQLIEAALGLPYEFVIPDVMFADELVELGTYERDTLLALGLHQGVLDGAGVDQATAYAAAYAPLSINDCFALVLAETTQDAILLTGDRVLRNVADNHQVEVHGLLWTTDQMHEHGTAGLAELHAALTALDEDPLVWLPRQELRRRIRELAGLLNRPV